MLNERLLILIVFGMGAIKVYEDYDENEGYSVYTPSEIEKKHSKRSIDLNETKIQSEKEEMVEISNEGLTKEILSVCRLMNEDDCSCKKLICFNEDNCNQVKNMNRSETKYLFDERKVWIKRCRQTQIWNQQLCECKRFLVKSADMKNYSISDLNIYGPIFEVF